MYRCSDQHTWQAWILTRAALALGILLAFTTAVASAAVWTVEKDGSADFSVIQDAIDAAAPGDSILIGPGRFSELPYYDEALFIGHIVAAVAKTDLTFIGSGSGMGGTVIGPPAPLYQAEMGQTIGFHITLGSDRVTVQDCRIENMNLGVALHASDAVIQRVEFQEFGVNGLTLAYDMAGPVIDMCGFASSASGTLGAVAAYAGVESDGTRITNCSFEANRIGVNFDGGVDLEIRGCTFSGHLTGIAIREGVNAQVADCRFSGITSTGLNISEQSSVTVRGCDVEMDPSGQQAALVRDVAVTFVENRLRGGKRAVVYALGNGDYYFRDNWFERIPGSGFVETLLNAEFTARMDMTLNYWGTTDSVEIADNILDALDMEDCPDHLFYCPQDTVDFWPILDSPPSVSAQPTSLGGLKGRFRGSPR